MKRKKSQYHNGFSLVELIVIISLFAIMSSVVSFDFQQYQRNIERVNLATDIALAFRQMQVYGISSSNRVIGGSSFETDSGLVDELVNRDLIQDTSVYGVQLDIENQELTLFQKVGSASDEYEEGVDVLVDRLLITGENKVRHICAASEGSAQINEQGECEFEQAGEQIDLGMFTAMFQRPFPDGQYYFTEQPGMPVNNLIIVVGIDGNSDAGFNNYIYLDAVGLIQSVGADAILVN